MKAVGGLDADLVGKEGEREISALPGVLDIDVASSGRHCVRHSYWYTACVLEKQVYSAAEHSVSRLPDI